MAFSTWLNAGSNQSISPCIIASRWPVKRKQLDIKMTSSQMSGHDATRTDHWASRKEATSFCQLFLKHLGKSAIQPVSHSLRRSNRPIAPWPLTVRSDRPLVLCFLLQRPQKSCMPGSSQHPPQLRRCMPPGLHRSRLSAFCAPARCCGRRSAMQL